MPDTNTPRVPPEAVRAAVSATRSTEPWCALAISAALPVIHAERDRDIVRRLRSLAPHEITCTCGNGDAFDAKAHDEKCPRRQVDDMLVAALDSLQVSGAGEKCETCGGTEVERRQGAGEWIEEPCPDCATDRSQPEAEEAVSLPHLISGEFGVSTSEARRLLHQGGVRIDGKVWRALDAPMSHLAGKELQIGKRRKTRLAQQPDPQDQEGGRP